MSAVNNVWTHTPTISGLTGPPNLPWMLLSAVNGNAQLTAAISSAHTPPSETSFYLTIGIQ